MAYIFTGPESWYGLAKAQLGDWQLYASGMWPIRKLDTFYSRFRIHCDTPLLCSGIKT
jgi:hypothetical protein